jgi:hypothetical protein
MVPYWTPLESDVLLSRDASVYKYHRVLPKIRATDRLRYSIAEKEVGRLGIKIMQYEEFELPIAQGALGRPTLYTT